MDSESELNTFSTVHMSKFHWVKYTQIELQEILRGEAMIGRCGLPKSNTFEFKLIESCFPTIQLLFDEYIN